MSRKFPRTGEDIVVLEGALYNRMVDELERSLRLAVAPPLRMEDTPAGRFLSLAGQQARIRIKITGSTQDGSNKRWKYDWSEVRKTSAGYGGWTASSDARTGHTTDYDYAFNLVEDINGASGAYGNGVNSSNLTGTLDIKPVPNGVILWAWVELPPVAGQKPELWFSYENGIDGGC